MTHRHRRQLASEHLEYLLALEFLKTCSRLATARDTGASIIAARRTGVIVSCKRVRSLQNALSRVRNAPVVSMAVTRRVKALQDYLDDA